MSKIKLFLAVLALGVVSLAPLAASAYNLRNEESVYIPKEQSIDGNLYTAGTSITIDGNVYGDVVCAAKSLTINGSVDGDVLCAASTIIINGPVSGSVRVIGESVYLNNQIKRNVNILGADVQLNKDSQVGGDVLAASASLVERGQINGSLHGMSDSWLIEGSVLGNVDARNDNPQGKFRLGEQAKIGGSLRYASVKDVQIDQKAVGGEIVRLVPKTKVGHFWPYVAGRAFGLFSALLIALVVMSLWFKRIKAVAVLETKKMLPQTLLGLAVMFLTPVACLLLIFTFIGAPLALILGVLWFIACYLAKILVGITFGIWLFKYLKKTPTKYGLLEMVVGVTALWVVSAIPFVGWAVSLIAMWWGLGMIAGTIKINR